VIRTTVATLFAFVASNLVRRRTGRRLQIDEAVEGTMIRRDILRQRSNRSVKWSLVAATLALSAGLYAEHALSVETNEEAAAVVQEAPTVAPAPPATAG
jgi:hypothetical protein